MATKDTYLQVYQPLDIRKTLLNSSIDCIKLMEEREKILRLRKSKYVRIDELKIIINDIKTLILKLDSDLPELKNAFSKEEISLRKDVKNNQIRKQAPSSFDDIEEEIMRIKDKIDKLNV